MNLRRSLQSAGLLLSLAAVPGATFGQMSNAKETSASESSRVLYRTAQVDGLKIFYREAGPKNAPTLVLLHGYPSSSHMFRNLIPALSDKYHLIAPDYPGFGYSDSPAPEQYAYTFDHLADTVDHFLDQRGITKYSIYIQDYGAPVGFRLATRHPDRVQAIITQNGNAYDEGLAPFWAEFLYPYWKDPNPTTEAKTRQILSLELTKVQYLQGFRNPEDVSPDSYTFDQTTLDRPGNDKIQLALFYDYRKNPPLYSSWHEYLRKYQPPVLAVWGKNDPVFLPAGAEAFVKDDPRTELHLLDTGHFALEEDGALIAQYIRDFLAKNVK
ncbi:MAG TPA: alpha/beta hydrolase [Candidatus Acidoferrum sp.]|nr:alpha/beta hydrolase [Candidatus Acidoferrum sp.]